MYDGRKHVCLEDNHIVNIFSFSKAYGMMGWRVGYVSVALYNFKTYGFDCRLLSPRFWFMAPPVCCSDHIVLFANNIN